MQVKIQDAILVELESFSNKDDTIESGANVLNKNVELCINYTSTTATNTFNPVFFETLCSLPKMKNWLVHPSPSCMIEHLYAKVDMGTTNDRLMLVPDLFNKFLGQSSQLFWITLRGL